MFIMGLMLQVDHASPQLVQGFLACCFVSDELQLASLKIGQNVIIVTS
jgi:hypothetical protein